MRMDSDSHGYITGGDLNLLHRRRIDCGGFGDVHEVQISAALLLIFSFTTPAIRRSVFFLLMDLSSKAFCKETTYSPASRNNSTRSGVDKKDLWEGSTSTHCCCLKLRELRNTHYYFIDMELCDLNLEDFIHGSASQNLSIPSLVKDVTPPLRALQTWHIMMQITSGLTYLHFLNVIH